MPQSSQRSEPPEKPERFSTLREPLIAVVTHMARVAVIVAIATSMALFGSSIHDLATRTLPTDLNQLFSGDGASIQQSVNDNLGQTVMAMAAIQAVQVPPGDVQSVADKARATDLAIFGTASPPMAVGAMLLMYNFAIALFVGLGPIFILCLVFDSTKALFQKWLLYGLATLFSLAMLSFVSAIVLQVTLRAATALWASDLINDMTGATSEGLSTQALEQGGIGLLMTLLIISVPPMAGNFFQATLGSYLPYSVFRGEASRPGPQGQPPGSYTPPLSSTRQPDALGTLTGTGGFGMTRLHHIAPAENRIRANPQFAHAPTASSP